MYLVAIAWMYVVVMMALAEALSSQGSLLGAAFTLLLYGLLPLSIVLYIMGTPLRRRRAQRAESGSVLPEDDGSHAAGLPVAAKREEV
jgi:membrane protein implicated in regulation of membrane protease activity